MLPVSLDGSILIGGSVFYNVYLKHFPKCERNSLQFPTSKHQQSYPNN
jgi:hypothetical protein